MSLRSGRAHVAKQDLTPDSRIERNKPEDQKALSMQNNNTELGYSSDALAERQAELLALLRQTAPEVFRDNQIDIEKIKELIGQERIASAEHYELSWAGKAAARREIQKTTSHTLLPADNNPPQAAHMLIEGENLEVLRVLQKSYHGKVKMIYIDPPYNTGNDSFVYPDDYSETLEEYQKRTGEKNEAGYLNKQSLWKKNGKESGQYHSAWLSMMYPRLYLARNLLRDDGVIFISIDDNEVANLRLLCDEIFGGENFVAQLVWEKKKKGAFLSGSSTNIKEYVLAYAKRMPEFGGLIGEIARQEETYPVIKTTNSRGVRLIKKGIPSKFKEKDHVLRVGERISSGNMEMILLSDLVIKDGFLAEDVRVESNWIYSQELLDKYASDKSLYVTQDLYFRRVVSEPREKMLKDILPMKGDLITGFDFSFSEDLFSDGWGTNEDGFDELHHLLGVQSLMSFPKPSKLLAKLVLSATRFDTECIVMDFFAGSGTAAHAVVELNLKGGGNRQCICVQMPELLEETSEAYKAGYRTIADIARARIDKVIAKLKAEHPDRTADLACAHFTLAPSSFKVWRGDVSDATALRETLDLFQRAEKTGLAPETGDAQTAMLAELLLKHGLGALGVHAINKPVQLAGVTVHRVLMHDDKQLWLCFEAYSSALKDEIVKARPAQVVLLNSCFVGDKADELLSNLQLELAGLDIGLTVI